TKAHGEASRERDVMLRRAAALPSAEDEDRAADIARRVVEDAASDGDKRSELAGLLELCLDLMRSPIGESYNPNPTESDFDGAADAYKRALEIATQLGDEHLIADCERELGVIATGRARAWFIEQMSTDF